MLQIFLDTITFLKNSGRYGIRGLFGYYPKRDDESTSLTAPASLSSRRRIAFGLIYAAPILHLRPDVSGSRP
jgi:hypothetical protein